MVPLERCGRLLVDASCVCVPFMATLRYYDHITPMRQAAIATVTRLLMHHLLRCELNRKPAHLIVSHINIYEYKYKNGETTKACLLRTCTHALKVVKRSRPNVDAPRTEGRRLFENH